MQIIYKSIKNGYARIDKDGKLLITIPLYQKNNKTFEKSLIEKGQELLKRYQKRIHITTIQKESMLLFGEQVPFTQLSHDNIQQNKKKLTKTMQTMLIEYATPILDTYSQKLGVPYKKLIVRKTKSKRGSCTHDQKISLNLDLVHLPTKYIKYVIIHECCHLKQKNHSQKFRSLVASFCPDYTQIKKELRKLVIK